MRSVILIGIQGSGKGTQAKLLSADGRYHVVGSGDLFRALRDDPTPRARKLVALTNDGHLAPDDVTMEIVADALDKIPLETGVIFDGVPRNENQRILLEKLLRKSGRSFDVVVLDLPDDIVYERLTSRAQKEGRKDDTPEAIAKRIATFRSQTVPLVDTWYLAGRAVLINGNQEVEAVQSDIKKKLEAHKLLHIENVITEAFEND